MDEDFLETLESDDVLYCNKCDKQIESESNYDYTFIDGETAEFTCSKCGTKYKVQIDRPIEKIVFVLKGE